MKGTGYQAVTLEQDPRAKEYQLNRYNYWLEVLPWILETTKGYPLALVNFSKRTGPHPLVRNFKGKPIVLKTDKSIDAFMTRTGHFHMAGTRAFTKALISIYYIPSVTGKKLRSFTVDFDIKSEKDFEKAREATVQVFKSLLADNFWPLILFTGSSFHITAKRLDNSIIGNYGGINKEKGIVGEYIKPIAEEYNIALRGSKAKIPGQVTIDYQVNKANGPLRFPLSLHKSGYVEIPLSPKELWHLSLDEIKERAHPEVVLKRLDSYQKLLSDFYSFLKPIRKKNPPPPSPGTGPGAPFFPNPSKSARFLKAIPKILAKEGPMTSHELEDYIIDHYRYSQGARTIAAILTRLRKSGIVTIVGEKKSGRGPIKVWDLVKENPRFKIWVEAWGPAGQYFKSEPEIGSLSELLEVEQIYKQFKKRGDVVKYKIHKKPTLQENAPELGGIVGKIGKFLAKTAQEYGPELAKGAAAGAGKVAATTAISQYEKAKQDKIMKQVQAEGRAYVPPRMGEPFTDEKKAKKNPFLLLPLVLGPDKEMLKIYEKNPQLLVNASRRKRKDQRKKEKEERKRLRQKVTQLRRDQTHDEPGVPMLYSDDPSIAKELGIQAMPKEYAEAMRTGVKEKKQQEKIWFSGKKEPQTAQETKAKMLITMLKVSSEERARVFPMDTIPGGVNGPIFRHFAEEALRTLNAFAEKMSYGMRASTMDDPEQLAELEAAIDGAISALAVLSLLPGGYDAFGEHFEVKL